MKEEIEKVIEGLSGLLQHSLDVDELVERKEALSADVVASQQTLDELKTKLEDAHAGLSSAQVEAQKKHDEAIYAKQQKLKDLDAKIATKSAEADEWEPKIASLRQQHDQIEASLASLKAKFA